HRHCARWNLPRSELRALPRRSRALSAPAVAGLGRSEQRGRSGGPRANGSRRRGVRQGAPGGADQIRGAASILARRIIPCLDVRDGAVVKGVRFADHQVVGAILELATRYRDEGADELVFYDIAASPGRRSVDRAWIHRVTALLDIPFCVAGGMRASGRSTLDWVREAQARGAGEIVLNCMAADGVREGYDLVHFAQVRSVTAVPLVASGGAGSVEHFRAVFESGVDAALAASVF